MIDNNITKYQKLIEQIEKSFQNNKKINQDLFYLISLLFENFELSKNAKEYARKAVAEADLTSEIRKWCEENLDKETMDIKLFSEEELSEDALSEEQKYFKRFEEIKSRISENFLNLDEGYLNRFVDEYYPVIFEDSEQS